MGRRLTVVAVVVDYSMYSGLFFDVSSMIAPHCRIVARQERSCMKLEVN